MNNWIGIEFPRCYDCCEEIGIFDTICFCDHICNLHWIMKHKDNKKKRSIFMIMELV